MTNYEMEMCKGNVVENLEAASLEKKRDYLASFFLEIIEKVLKKKRHAKADNMNLLWLHS